MKLFFLINIDDEISNNLFYSVKKKGVFSLKILLQKHNNYNKIFRTIIVVKKALQNL